MIDRNNRASWVSIDVVNGKLMLELSAPDIQWQYDNSMATSDISFEDITYLTVNRVYQGASMYKSQYRSTVMLEENYIMRPT